MINSDWSKDFNTSGGSEEVVLYKSPFSPHDSDNAKHGTLTNGILPEIYDPPVLMKEAPTGSGIYLDRLNMQKVNEAPMKVVDVTAVQPQAGTIEEAFRTRRRKEKYGVAGLVGSEVIHGSAPVETFRKRKERFEANDTKALIVIIVCIFAICLAGFSCGVLVPKLKIKHKVKMVEPKKESEERLEAF